MGKRIHEVALALGLAAFAVAPALAQECIVPTSQIISGEPGNDGIPSLQRPYPYEGLEDRVLINDEVGGRPVLVVYDREAQMAVAFDRQIGDRLLSFGAADAMGFPFLFRDHETGSTWDLTGQAVAGELSGARIEPVATYSAMWFAWAVFHQGTEIYQPPRLSRPDPRRGGNYRRPPDWPGMGHG